MRIRELPLSLFLFIPAEGPGKPLGHRFAQSVPVAILGHVRLWLYCQSCGVDPSPRE